MTPTQPDTEQLLEQARKGDTDARARLLMRHRQRLSKMIACRLDRRLAARIDPSDIVQEVLAEANWKLYRYLRDHPLPFYPWLRQLAWEQLATLHRRHVPLINLARFGPGVCVGKLANWSVKSLFCNDLAVCHAKTQLANWQTRSRPLEEAAGTASAGPSCA